MDGTGGDTPGVNECDATDGDATGHRVSLDTALQWVENCTRGYRLPEPTRWADAVASNRTAFQRWQNAL